MRLELTISRPFRREGPRGRRTRIPGPSRARSATPHRRSLPKRKFSPTTTSRARRRPRGPAPRRRGPKDAGPSRSRGTTTTPSTPASPETLQTLVEGLDEGDVPLVQRPRRMGEERQDEGRRVLSLRPAPGRAEDLPVAEMNAVEIADGDDGSPGEAGAHPRTR